MDSIVTLKNNKLFLNKEAAELLDVKADDRIDIKFWTENNQTTFPIIGRIDAFTDSEGKRVTKKLTVSYRGVQAEVLGVYGTEFTLTPFKDKLFKMEVKQEEDALAEEESDLNALDTLDLKEEVEW